MPRSKIELSEKNLAWRIAALSLTVCIAIVSLIYGFTHLFATESGWKEVEAATDRRNCSDEFKLHYYFGASGASATAENKRLSMLYTEAMENAYIIFNRDEPDDTVKNLYYVNQNLNADIEVDEHLYKALSKVEEYDSRYIYLAPVYTEYERIFICDNSDEAAMYDPAHNGELVEYITRLAAFALDPDSIDLELLGGNRLRVKVSEEYLAFAREYEIESLLDFSWTKNAFIADYVADLLTAEGYCMGAISSYDGFTRNLDTAGNSYSVNIFDRVGNDVYIPAAMSYTKPISIVSLRNYALTEADRWHYFSFADGSIATIFIDPTDGMSKSSIGNMVSYSYSDSCADVLLQVAPVFIADRFDVNAVSALAAKGVNTVWGSDMVLNHTDPELTLSLNAEAGVEYSTNYCPEQE